MRRIGDEKVGGVVGEGVGVGVVVVVGEGDECFDRGG